MTSTTTSSINHTNFNSIFITVGTTEFNELISSIDNLNFINILHGLNCKILTVQIGRGIFPTKLQDTCDKNNIQYSCFRFKEDLYEVMKNSDLIISHCGAGSILEAMTLRKSLIVIVNSTLQGNHQSELSDALAINGHCLTTLPRQLIDCISRIVSKETDIESFTCPFPDPDYEIFPALVNDIFGFV